MNAREIVVAIHPVAEEIGGGRSFAGLIEAQELIAQDVEDSEPGFTDHELEKLSASCAFDDGREIVALRIERTPDGLTFHVTLLTEENL